MYEYMKIEEAKKICIILHEAINTILKELDNRKDK